MSIGVTAITFKGKKTASQAMRTLEDYSPNYVWVDDVAILSRSKHGNLRVHSTWAQDDDRVGGGIGWGGLTGGLIGALAGPAGALAGAVVGGGIGGGIGSSVNMDFSDPRLDAFAASLENNTSALILVADEITLADFNDAIGSLDGRIIHTDLDDNDVKSLRKALKKSMRQAS